VKQVQAFGHGVQGVVAVLEAAEGGVHPHLEVAQQGIDGHEAGCWTLCLPVPWMIGSWPQLADFTALKM
jgi:hypothetical protein